MIMSLDDLFGRMAKPGSVWLTSGFRGGGKSHTAIALAEQFVKGKYPSVGKVIVVTNIIFFHKTRHGIVEETPEGVYHVHTMRDLFPIITDTIEQYGRNVTILLILDEAQNFIGGDSNQSNASVMMKEFLGIIRKFCMMVWFLTPSANSIGPAFRNYLNDNKYPGNLTAKWKKDLGLNARYIESTGMRCNPNELMLVRNFDMDEPIFIKVPVTEWTKTKDKLKEGEYCYDHEASATFHVGEGFNWAQFNREIGGVSSLNVVRTIKEFYKGVQTNPQQKVESGFVIPADYKIELCVRAVRDCGLTLKTACQIVQVPYPTMRRWLDKAGIKLKELTKNSSSE